MCVCVLCSGTDASLAQFNDLNRTIFRHTPYRGEKRAMGAPRRALTQRSARRVSIGRLCPKTSSDGTQKIHNNIVECSAGRPLNAIHSNLTIAQSDYLSLCRFGYFTQHSGEKRHVVCKGGRRSADMAIDAKCKYNRKKQQQQRRREERERERSRETESSELRIRAYDDCMASSLFHTVGAHWQ